MGRDAVAFDASGQSLLVCDFAGADVRRIDLASGKSTVFFIPPKGSRIVGMCSSADRTRLAVADRRWVALVDAQTGETLVEAKTTSDDMPSYWIVETLPYHLGDKLLAVSSDNRHLAVASGRNFWLCDADNKLEPGVLIACDGPFAFVPGRQEIATLIKNGIRYFDLEGRQLDSQDLLEGLSEQFSEYLNEVHELTFLPDGDQLIFTIRGRLRLVLAELTALGGPFRRTDWQPTWPFRPTANWWRPATRTGALACSTWPMAPRGPSESPAARGPIGPGGCRCRCHW